MNELILVDRDPMDPAEVARLSAWLAANGPDQWHYLAQRWNFDFGIHPLAWIIQQPDCDRATAQLMFFHVSDWLLLWDSARKAGRPLPDNDEIRLMNYIMARWQADGFVRSELASSSMPHDWGLANLKAVPYGVPASLFEPIEGRKADRVPWGEEMPAGIETPR